MRVILIWLGLMAWLSAHAQLLTPPVRPEIRNSITREPTWTEVSTPPGTVTRGGAVGGLITGWGTPIGAPQSFRRVQIPITAGVSGYIPTRVRVRIREGDYNGTTLADATATVALTLGVTRMVDVTFTAVVTNAVGTNLWADIITDGRIDEWRINETPYSTPTARYWVDANVTSPASVPTLAASQRNYPVTCLSENASATIPVLSSTMAGLIESDTILARVVTPTYGITATTTIGTRTTTRFATSSTFSGWGMGLPPTYETNAFDAVSFFLYPFDAAAIPTQVRVRIRSMPTNVAQWTNNPSTFAIIADTTVNVTAAASTDQRVTARFSSPIYGTNLWIDYQCNGRDGGMAAHATLTNLTPAPPGRWYTTSGSLSSGSWVKALTDFSFHLELGRQSTQVASYEVTDEFKGKLSVVPTATAVSIQLPPTVWALEGRELNLYWRNVIRSSAPLETLGVDVTCSKGAQWGAFGGFWRYTPSAGDAGSTTLTVTVRNTDTGQTLASASAGLVTRALLHPASTVNRRLHCIGDSTLGGSGSAVLAELVNLFTGDTRYGLTLVGSNDGAVNDSGSVSRTVRCDAISGWRVDMFHTNSTTGWTEIGGTARTGSPFVFGGSFSYSQFLATNSITMSSGDWVLVHLGINDIFGFTDDSSLQSQVDDMATRIEAMVANIQTAVPGVRVVICTTIPPNDSQDGFAQDYGSGQTLKRYQRNRYLWAERILSQFANRTAANIWVLGYGDTLDTVNNFASASAQVNARNSSTYIRASAGSGVHPAPSGYYQLADTVRSFLKGIE